MKKATMLQLVYAIYNASEALIEEMESSESSESSDSSINHAALQRLAATEVAARRQVKIKNGSSGKNAGKAQLTATSPRAVVATAPQALKLTRPTLTAQVNEGHNAREFGHVETRLPGHKRSGLAKPNFGDASCAVGEFRTKLPKSLFNGFEGIILRFADGRTHEMHTSSEGRGRLTLNQTDDIGAFYSQEHHLVFLRDVEYGNVYDVVIWSPQASNHTGSSVVARPPVVVKATPRAAIKRAQVEGQEKRPAKPATPAQKETRAKFAARVRAGEFRKGKQYKAGEKVEVQQPNPYGVSHAIVLPRSVTSGKGHQSPSLVRVTDGSESLEGAFDDVRTVDTRQASLRVPARKIRQGAVPLVVPNGQRVSPVYVVPPRKR